MLVDDDVPELELEHTVGHRSLQFAIGFGPGQACIPGLAPLSHFRLHTPSPGLPWVTLAFSDPPHHPKFNVLASKTGL